MVRVRWAGICGTDLDILKGEIDLVTEGRVRYPVRIGHEWSGVVERVGPEAVGFAPGDRVVSETAVSCGECPACREGRYGQCERGYRSIGTIDDPWPGAMAEYIALPWWSVYKIPESVAMDAAALAEPASIAYSAILNGNISPEDKVLIIGTGAIGLAAAGLLRCRGVRNVYMAGRQDEKLRIAREMGAAGTVNMRTGNFREEVMALTGGKGAEDQQHDASQYGIGNGF